MPRPIKWAVGLPLLVAAVHTVETLITLVIGRYLPVPTWSFIPLAAVLGGGFGWWLSGKAAQVHGNITRADELDLPYPAAFIPFNGPFLDINGDVMEWVDR